MQASTLSLLAAPLPPPGPPGPRNTGIGAGGFSRILDEVGAGDGASEAAEVKPPSADDPVAIDLPETDQGQVPDPNMALPLPLPPLAGPQAAVVLADPAVPVLSDEMPGPLLTSRIAGPLASAALAAGADTPDAPPQNPVFSAAMPIVAAAGPLVPEGPAPQAARSDTQPVEASVPVASPQPPAVNTFPVPPAQGAAMRAAIRVGPSGTDARRPYSDGTAALSFALRSASGTADEVTGQVATDPATPPVAAIAANAVPDAVGPPLASEAELLRDPMEDTVPQASLAGQPAPERPAAPGPAKLPDTPASLPANLGHDLAAIVEKAPDGPVEISLSPDELGKLRVSLWQDGSGLRVMVQAERAETLDLLRRNGDQLMLEIRASGFAGGSLSFGQWGGPPSRSGGIAAGPQPETSGPLPIPAPTPHITTNLAPSSSLDLRY